MPLRRLGVASLILWSLGLVVSGCGGSEDAASIASALGPESKGALSTDSDKYRSPSTVTVTVADWDVNLVGTTQEVAHVSAANLRTGKSLNNVKLTETDVNTGSFVGTFDLVIVDDKGKLTAANGDTIRITYHDADDGTGHAVDVTKDITVDNTSPNVSMTSVTVAPPALKAGETLNITYTVANDAIGQASGGSSVLVTVLDENQNQVAGWWRYAPALAPGDPFTDTFPFQVPAGWSGSFYVRATAYTGGDLTPSNDSLTSGSFSVAGPDVGVESVTFAPPSLKAGETINISYAVRNSASAGASAGSSVLVTVLDENQNQVAGWWRYAPALVPGDPFTDTFPFQVPAGWSGNFHVKAVAYTSGDRNPGNDSRTSGSFSVAGPDVGVESVTFAPPSLKAGETINISYAVRNSASAGASAGSSVLVTVLDENQNQVAGWWRYAPGLAPGDPFTDTFPFQVPAGWNGSFHVRATAYTAGDLTQSNDSRTSGSFSVAGPDVGVESVTFAPPSLKAGETINISYAVRNSASAGASAGSSVLVTVLDENQNQVAGWWRYAPGLAPGDPFTDTFPFQVPAGWSGSFYVRATAYTGGDLNPTNDSRTSGSFSIAGPDVGVESVTFTPLSLTAGETINISYAVSNSPSAGASAGSSVLVTVLDENQNQVAGWWRYAPALAPGEPFTDTFPFQVPAGWSGSFYVKAVAYTGGDLNPTNDSSTSYEPFVVAGPDVGVESVTFTPLSLTAGETINISYAVRNGPLAGASAGSSVLVVVLDQNQNQVAGWWRYTPALASGDPFTDTFPFQIPAGWSGSFYVRATAYTGGDLNPANDSRTSDSSFAVVP